MPVEPDAFFEAVAWARRVGLSMVEEDVMLAAEPHLEGSLTEDPLCPEVSLPRRKIPRTGREMVSITSGARPVVSKRRLR